MALGWERLTQRPERVECGRQVGWVCCQISLHPRSCGGRVGDVGAGVSGQTLLHRHSVTTCGGLRGILGHTHSRVHPSGAEHPQHARPSARCWDVTVSRSLHQGRERKMDRGKQQRNLTIKSRTDFKEPKRDDRWRFGVRSGEREVTFCFIFYALSYKLSTRSF